MKRKAKKAAAQVSQWWKPKKVGEAIEGVFGGLAEGSWKNKPTYSMRVGEHLVGIGAVLMSFIRGNPKVFAKAGAELRIEYTGNAKNPNGGKPIKKYAVSADGKALFQDGAFQPKPIGVAELVKRNPRKAAKGKGKSKAGK